MSSPSIPPGMGGGSMMDGLSMAASQGGDQQDQQGGDTDAKLDAILGLLTQIADKLGIGQDDEDQQDNGDDESMEDQGGGNDSFSDDEYQGPPATSKRRSAFAGG